MAARRLRATWSLEGATDLFDKFVGRVIDVDYIFVAQIRWWQFWRWHRAWSEDYTLSRAAELILVRKASAQMRRQIDAELRSNGR